MYARYIPPPKPSVPSRAVDAPPNPKPPTPPPVPTTNSPFGYSRWVPPAKSRPAAAALPDRTEAESQAMAGSLPKQPKQKRKREDEETAEASTKIKKSKKDNPTAAPEATRDDPIHSEQKAKRKSTKDKKRPTAADTGSGSDSEAGETKAKTPPHEAASEAPRHDKHITSENKPKQKRNAEEGTKETRRKTKSKSDIANAANSEAGSERDELEDTTESKKERRKNEENRRHETHEADARHKSVLDKQRRSLKLAQKIAAAAESKPAAVVAVDDAPENASVHSIGPLPQPEPVLPDKLLPTYSTLPPWLSSPINVSQDTRAPFTELGIPEKVQAFLSARGFPEAFAVQTAAMPLLIPSSRTHPSDVLIAAATGSGKTLAYALPVVRDISTGRVTRLRALVVLPTRELVRQAREVLEVCAAAWAEVHGHRRARIGISVGNQVLEQEQDALMECLMRYDPAAARRRGCQRSGSEADSPQWCESDGCDGCDGCDGSDGPDGFELDDIPPDHVCEYGSKVDVLICTPGRLVEHMQQTAGFTLDYVRWLIIDEADKILSNSFQGWLDMITPAVHSASVPGARDFPGCNVTGVRKVLLSATLTRDLSLLGPLRLRRPRLVVLEGASAGGGATVEHVLPEGLSEMAVRVKDGAIKPLYLVELLQGSHLRPLAGENTKEEEEEEEEEEGGESETSLFPTTALVFTKSNEAALRLSRLVALVAPTLAATIGTLTSSTPTATRRRILRAFGSRRTRILVASDLVARGIDFPSLDHVINYDVPASVPGYVHRVGRTARAGRQGRAWTLVDDTESGWFWGRIGKEGGIRRKKPVERVKMGAQGSKAFDDERIDAYERALEQVGAEAGRQGKHIGR